jgi:hypothetical protein
MINFYAVNRWDENDEFNEWAKPSGPFLAEAECILGVTNAQLACCRSTDEVWESFISFATV